MRLQPKFHAQISPFSRYWVQNVTAWSGERRYILLRSSTLCSVYSSVRFAPREGAVAATATVFRALWQRASWSEHLRLRASPQRSLPRARPRARALPPFLRLHAVLSSCTSTPLNCDVSGTRPHRTEGVCKEAPGGAASYGLTPPVPRRPCPPTLPPESAINSKSNSQ